MEKIAGAGHEIAFHGFAHRLVYEQTPDDFRDEVVRGRQMLEEISAQEVKGFRAPPVVVEPALFLGLEILAESGYLYDSSHASLPIIGDPAYP